MDATARFQERLIGVARDTEALLGRLMAADAAAEELAKNAAVQSKLPNDSGTAAPTPREDGSPFGGGGIYIPGGEAIVGLLQWALIVVAAITLLAVAAILIREPLQSRFVPATGPPLPLEGDPPPPADPRELLARADRLAASGQFAEWANVFGHFYGTSNRQLRAAQTQGKDLLLDIDVQGHRQVRRRFPDAVSVFLLPPSYHELERRLRRRHSDAPEVIASRLANARRELGHWREYDYLVVNDKLPEAARALRGIVTASRFRRTVQRVVAQRISKTFGGKKA